MIRYFEKQVNVIEAALSSIDEAAFNQLVEASATTLASGKRVVITGLGKNVPICEKFVGSMVSMGLDALFMNTDSAMHGDMGCVRDGDLLIVLSKSGETEESIRLVQELLRQGRDIDIWLLTYRRESTLSKLVSHCLAMDLAHEGDMWNVMPINSSSICLIVLQGLAVLVGERLGVTLDQFGRNHPGGAIGEYLRNGEVR